MGSEEPVDSPSSSNNCGDQIRESLERKKLSLEIKALESKWRFAAELISKIGAVAFVVLGSLYFANKNNLFDVNSKVLETRRNLLELSIYKFVEDSARVSQSVDSITRMLDNYRDTLSSVRSEKDLLNDSLNRIGLALRDTLEKMHILRDENVRVSLDKRLSDSIRHFAERRTDSLEREIASKSIDELGSYRKLADLKAGVPTVLSTSSARFPFDTCSGYIIGANFGNSPGMVVGVRRYSMFRPFYAGTDPHSGFRDEFAPGAVGKWETGRDSIVIRQSSINLWTDTLISINLSTAECDKVKLFGSTFSEQKEQTLFTIVRADKIKSRPM